MKSKRSCRPYRLVTAESLLRIANIIPCGAAANALVDMLKRHKAGQKPICFEDRSTNMLVVCDVAQAEADGLEFYE